MKHSLLLVALLGFTACSAVEPTANSNTPTTAKTTTKVPAPSNITVMCPNNNCEKKQEVKKETTSEKEDVLTQDTSIRIGVIGQGVAPLNTASPAQAYALAKRAATADAYRLIAEKVKGVRVDGEDLIKNMMVKRSTVRTSVKAMVRNANIVETTFKDGLCEVEMEITLSHADFAQ
jgi:hypothetical protein